jgi:carbonic anhydrase
MRVLPQIFANNSAWAERTEAEQPGFFQTLARQQSPDFLWIGCADSRVPANQIVGLLPGELFVHRNVANLVVHTDLNCLSVMQFAVDVLQVEHIIVCGHYGCGGVRAALQQNRLGLIDNWLRHIQDVAEKHAHRLSGIADHDQQVAKLCELNIIEQALNVCQTTIVQDAWSREQAITVHGWVYDIQDGLLQDLGFCVTGQDDLLASYNAALAAH